MVRECLFGVSLALGAGALGGCSLMLDFSDEAIPKDAAPDAPYTQEQCDYKEPNNALAEAQPLAPGETGPAAICAADPEDHDFYKITIPANTASATFSISFTNRPTGDIDMILRDTAGTMLSQSRGFGDGETIACPGASPPCSALAAGDVVLEVFPAIAGAVNAYDLAITITPM